MKTKTIKFKAIMAKAKKMKSKGEVLTAAMAARIINPQTMEVQHG